jgi:hypothetical protein
VAYAHEFGRRVLVDVLAMEGLDLRHA